MRACIVVLVALLFGGLAEGQQRKVKPAPKEAKVELKYEDWPKLHSVAKLKTVEVLIQGYVLNCNKFDSWKQDNTKISFIVKYSDGPKYNIRIDFYDADNVRINGVKFPSEWLIKDEKSKGEIDLSKFGGDNIKFMKITRELDN